MQVDWGNLKTAIERGMVSAERGERGSLRVHCGSAERMLKGVKTDEGKEVLDKVHHAGHSIDLAKSLEHLKAALLMVTPYVEG